MQYSEREYLVNKVISGCTVCTFNNEIVYVYEPNPTEKVAAQSIYFEEYRKAELLGVPSEEEILGSLKSMGMWNKILQDELDKIPKALEELKVELYNAYFQFKRREGIKKSLDSIRFREVELWKQRDILKYVTCEGFALTCKNRHLICSGTKRSDGSKLFIKGYEEYPQNELDIFINEYFANKINDNVIRLLSQEEPWRTIWNAGKNEGSIFGIPSSLLSQEQKMILVWSRIYDSIYESPDCPPDEVIDDDDCLDGWMILQSRNRQKDRQSEHGFNPGDKYNKADEVFMFVENPEDIDRVHAMNNPAAILRKQQRMSALSRAGGKIEDQFMPDSQTKIKEQYMQMQKRGKG